MRKNKIFFFMRWSALLASIAVLAGCVSRMDLPAQKAVLESQLPQWWVVPQVQFGLAEDIAGLVDNPEVQALIQEALDANLDLVATAYRLKVSGLLLSVTSSALLPSLTVGGEVLHV
ncbi:MAG: TolC family protein [Pseudodesulfovibrio sp.]|nr:TolC family protein [Pseudodesulfovibrio sp.]